MRPGRELARDEQSVVILFVASIYLLLAPGGPRSRHKLGKKHVLCRERVSPRKCRLGRPAAGSKANGYTTIRPGNPVTTTTRPMTKPSQLQFVSRQSSHNDSSSQRQFVTATILHNDNSSQLQFVSRQSSHTDSSSQLPFIPTTVFPSDE